MSEQTTIIVLAFAAPIAVFLCGMAMALVVDRETRAFDRRWAKFDRPPAE
jgi:hypothetical protein